jgi:hypothetical protein
MLGIEFQRSCRGGIAEQRAHPGEMAITRSILEAVAAADLRHKGQLLETIRMYQQQMQTEQTDIGADNQGS